MEIETPLVIVVSGDAGGTRAIAPVVQLLCLEKRVRVQIFTYAQAGAVWQDYHLPYEELDTQAPRLKARNLLGESDVRLLLAGTSVNVWELEKLFIAEARNFGVPTLAVLDFWTNYIPRFNGINDQFQFVPDCIAIMDEWAKDEMTLIGFDPCRLVITGQPALDNLATFQAEFLPTQRQVVRMMLEVTLEEKLILFASQPFSQLYGNPTDQNYLGYDEQSVLQALVKALDHLAEQHDQKIVLCIRPHPRETIEVFKTIQGRNIHVIVSNRGTAREQVKAADLVVGMNSILLMEACYLGCLVVSLQPNLRGADVLPTNRWEMSQVVYHYEAILPVLEELLFNSTIQQRIHARLSRLSIDGLATQRVAKLIYEMTGLSGVKKCQN